MRTIHFTKAEGAQNDFVIVDDRQALLSHEERQRIVRLISHRRKGVGADGAIFIDASTECDFIMTFYNPDGSVGSMCGNGGRCAALYVFVNNIAESSMTFEVLGKTYTARVDGEDVTLSFPPPSRIDPELILPCEFGDVLLSFVDTGAPHAVLFAEDLPGSVRNDYHALDMLRIGHALRWHKQFAPVGVNVNVLHVDGNIVHVRTFEKGVENETQACGTGSVAAAIAAHIRVGLPPPIMLRTHGGEALHVGFSPNASKKRESTGYYETGLFLQGPAHLVFDGCYVLPNA